MPPETLEFEEPIGVLMKEIEALSMMPRTDARQLEIESLKRRIESIRVELYRTLTPWQRVLVARHPSRPGLCFRGSSRFTVTAGLPTITRS